MGSGEKHSFIVYSHYYILGQHFNIETKCFSVAFRHVHLLMELSCCQTKKPDNSCAHEERTASYSLYIFAITPCFFIERVYPFVILLTLSFIMSLILFILLTYNHNNLVRSRMSLGYTKANRLCKKPLYSGVGVSRQ